MIIDKKMQRMIEEFLDKRDISDIPIRNFGRLLIITFLMDYIEKCVELVERQGDERR